MPRRSDVSASRLSLGAPSAAPSPRELLRTSTIRSVSWGWAAVIRIHVGLGLARDRGILRGQVVAIEISTVATVARWTRVARARSGDMPVDTPARSDPRRRDDCPPGSTRRSRRREGEPGRAPRSPDRAPLSMRRPRHRRRPRLVRLDLLAHRKRNRLMPPFALVRRADADNPFARVDLALDQCRQAFEAGASMPAALRLGYQRDRVEAPRSPADARPGLFRELRRRAALPLAVAALRREHGRVQVADAGEPGEGLEPRTLGEREVDALAPDTGCGDPSCVEAEALARRRPQRGRVLGGAGDLDPDDIVGALADEAGATKTSPSIVRRSASALPSTSAAIPSAAAACAGRRAKRSHGRGYARRRTPWQGAHRLHEPFESSRTEARVPIDPKASRRRWATPPTAPRGRSGRSRPARSRSSA